MSTTSNAEQPANPTSNISSRGACERFCVVILNAPAERGVYALCDGARAALVKWKAHIPSQRI